jgi:hypothetical protein
MQSLQTSNSATPEFTNKTQDEQELNARGVTIGGTK